MIAECTSGLRHLFGRAIDLWQIRETVTPTSFARRRRLIENAVDRLVFRAFLPETPEADTTKSRSRGGTSCVGAAGRPDCPSRGAFSSPARSRPQGAA